MKQKLFKFSIICIIIFFVIVALLIYFCHFHNGLSENAEDYSYFGDYIGGTIGAIMAFVSALLIYMTYLKQVKFSEEQTYLARKSQFENNLFNMLSTQREIASQLSFKCRDPMDPANTRLYVGAEAINHTANIIKDVMLELGFDPQETNKALFADLRVKIDELFGRALKPYGISAFGHYFRHLYHTIKFIDKSGIEDKKKYALLVQAQMSNDELFLLFFNALSNYGYPKLYHFVSKYSLVENLYYRDFDYFKILQRRCYPNVFFKQSPNNAVLVVGYFSKLRESVMIEISNEFDMVLVDVEDIVYGSPDHYRLRTISGERKSVNHISDIIEEGKNYLFDGTLIVKHDDRTEIADRTMLELNPKAIISCIDTTEIIQGVLSERQKAIYDGEAINHIMHKEQECARYICRNYNIPLLECASTNKERMVSFLSGVLNL